jgi:hypothetical protein
VEDATHFAVEVTPEVENTIAGAPAVNPDHGFADVTGFVTCPRGHRTAADDSIIGDADRFNGPTGTWSAE